MLNGNARIVDLIVFQETSNQVQSANAYIRNYHRYDLGAFKWDDIYATKNTNDAVE